MEPEIIAIAGVMLILLVVGTFIYAPGALQSTGHAVKAALDNYVDWIIVLAAALVALITTAIVSGFYIAEGNPRDAYLAAAAFIYLVKLALRLLDTLAGRKKFLLSTMADVLDLAIIGLIFLSVYQRSETY